MELREAIKTRRSIRKYQAKDVPTESILEAISLAAWAPNGGNYQPWKFFVVKNRKLIERMADAVQAKVDRMASWPEAAEFGRTFERYRANASFFRSAPAVIAVAMGGYQSAADKVLRRRGDTDPEAREMIRNREEISSRIQTIAGATGYLLLALHEQGLGACWMAGPMLARREIEQMLEMPADVELFALVPVGYPAESPEPGPRKPLEDVVRVIE
ncbi:MAG: nitroreductase family protein [Sphingomonadaceae bacterium]